MVYCVSDIHGRYDLYLKMLDKINLKSNDCLVILGDAVDRGPDGIRLLCDIKERENVILFMGNHEAMMLEVLEFISKEITEESIDSLDEKTLGKLANWLYSNGGEKTLDGYYKLSKSERKELLDYVACLPCYEEFTINNQKYLLIHTGMGDDFSPEKDIDDYDEYDLLWPRLDYNRIYYPAKIIVSGHTPTEYIPQNEKPNYIYKGNNHIAIDCGACSDNGRLGAICLNTGEEYYVE